MTAFWIALQFLTTFPVSLKAIPTHQQNGQSVLFYPLIGMLIGVILYLVAWCLVPVPLVLQTAILVVLWVWLTGGLHLDGLADTADAWVGGFGDRERTLTIMKDPSCGPIGVLSIVMVLLLKAATVYVLLQQSVAAVLILIPCLARTAPLILFATCNYVRQQGIAKHIAQHLPTTWLWWVSSISILSSFSLGWIAVALILSLAIGLMYLRAKFIKRLGGITGDTIGASIEILETILLLAAAIYFSYSVGL